MFSNTLFNAYKMYLILSKKSFCTLEQQLPIWILPAPVGDHDIFSNSWNEDDTQLLMQNI